MLVDSGKQGWLTTYLFNTFEKHWLFVAWLFLLVLKHTIFQKIELKNVWLDLFSTGCSFLPLENTEIFWDIVLKSGHVYWVTISLMQTLPIFSFNLGSSFIGPATNHCDVCLLCKALLIIHNPSIAAVVLPICILVFRVWTPSNHQILMPRLTH